MRKKHIVITLLALVLCIIMLLPVSAAYPYLVDHADILSAGEEKALISELTDISTKYGITVAVVTVETLEGRSAQAYTNDYYNKNYGAKTDGVMLLLAMDEREYYILTQGRGKTAIPNSRIDYIADRFVSDLSDGDYFDGFMSFASVCEEHIENEKNGNPYTEPLLTFSDILIALAIGIVGSLIMVSVMKGQLKTVRMQKTARGYIRDNSFILTKEKDRFLYRNVTRRPRPKDNGSSGGGRSSGGSRGGGGGKF